MSAFGPPRRDAGVKIGVPNVVLLFVDGVKPGGGSMPSSISMARCIRALRSLSSVG